jgi:hypothetical protein
MKFNKQIIDHILTNYQANRVFIGGNIKKKNPDVYATLTSGLNCVDLKSADTIIDHDIVDFCKPIVISESRSRFPNTYNYSVINKMCDVAVYHKKNQGVNDHLIQNCFRLNNNPDLFSFEISQPEPKVAAPITQLEGMFNGKRALIVGSGPSWQNINYDLLADDIVVLVVNYNFEIKADYQIFTDKVIGEDLKAVRFKDGRKIIGNIENIDGQADYYFSQFEHLYSCLHTGAYALQIAKILGFDKTYLIGFDYTRYPNGKDYSYKKRSQYTYKNSGQRLWKFIEDFKKFKAKGVYQLNPESRLKKYPNESIGVVYAKN